MLLKVGFVPAFELPLLVLVNLAINHPPAHGLHARHRRRGEDGSIRSPRENALHSEALPAIEGKMRRGRLREPWKQKRIWGEREQDIPNPVNPHSPPTHSG